MNHIVIHRAASSVTGSEGPAHDAWNDTTWHGPLTRHGEPGFEAAPGTSFALVHNGTQVVACIRATEPDMDRVDADVIEQPRDVWSHDHVELFLDPGGAGRTCFQVGVNRRGDVAQVWRSGCFELFDPNLGAEAAAGVDHQGWWACIAVPLTALDFSKPASRWKVNVARVRVLKGEKAQTSTFAPVQKLELYDPATFPAAEVEALDPANHQWDVQLKGPATVSSRGNERRFQQSVRIVNRGALDRTVSVAAQLDEGMPSTPLTDMAVAAGDTRDALVDTALTESSFRRLGLTVTDAATNAPLRRCAFAPDTETFSWKEHHTFHGDGKGGFVSHPAQYQFLPRYHGGKVVPYGLAQMDNGEILFAGSAAGEGGQRAAVVAFSNDGGETWSDYRRPETPCGSPMMLIYLGRGDVAFRSSWEHGGPQYYVSHDYGRTWPEQHPVALTPDGFTIDCEGSPLVDRDDQGIATAIAEPGQIMTRINGLGYCRGCVHWTRDRFRTWEDFVYPDAWVWEDTFEGETLQRGSGEGALVRAANGNLVAAMRMDCEGRHLKYAYDQFEGTGVSISKDEGRTWSPIQRVCDAGRMHANLVRLDDGDLVMTVIRRMDHRDGRFASYRRGCDAFVSHDHGETWDPKEMIILDDWPHHDPDFWYGSVCGHLYSAVLDDGTVLTAYSKHDVGGVLIRWQP